MVSLQGTKVDIQEVFVPQHIHKLIHDFPLFGKGKIVMSRFKFLLGV